MAVRNQVLSLFGATPEQIMQQERARQAEFLAAQRDPFQSAGAAIGVGLGRLFGGESQEVAQARQMQEAVAGIDPNNPDALRSLAQTVSSFAPERALQIAAYASELEKSMMGSVEQVPIQIGMKQEPVLNTFGLPILDANGQPMMQSVPEFRNFPMERTPSGFQRIAGVEYPGATSPANANANDSQVAPQDTVIDLGDGVGLVRQEQLDNPQAPTPPFTVQQDPRITPEAQEAIASATGPRGGGSMGSITAVPPPPALQAETTYLNPQEAQIISDQIRDEITALDRSNDPNKAQKIAELKKQRARIQKLRIASRRQDQEKNLRSRRGK